MFRESIKRRGGKACPRAVATLSGQAKLFPRRIQPISAIARACCFLFSLSLVHAALTVDPSGTLLKDNAPYRAIGVNYYDAFVRALTEKPDFTSGDGFKELAERGIPFARFSAGGYWPRDWQLYQTNRAEYFRRFDAVVASARKHQVGLIPSLFWYLATVPDLVGEPISSWGATNSRTHQFMREYTKTVVSRYATETAIWGWEFGNEYNLPADLPNAAQHRHAVVPALGTPNARSPADDLTHEMIRTALRVFAEEVRRYDKSRIIVSGNAFPRPSAWHQASEKSWRRDTPGQFATVLEADNPFPVDTLSVRAYDLTNDVGRLAMAMEVARSVRKPLFVGEFGASGQGTEIKAPFAAILDSILANKVPLAALWVYDFGGQSADWSVTATNARSWQLDAIQRANRQIRQAR